MKYLNLKKDTNTVACTAPNHTFYVQALLNPQGQAHPTHKC